MDGGCLVSIRPSGAAADERTLFSYRDHGFTACSMNDPAMATTTMTPEAGKPVYTKIRVGALTDFSTTRLITAQAATEQLANAFFGIFNSAGERLGVSADLSATFKAAAGEKGLTVVADGGKSLLVEGGPGIYVYGSLLFGTQGTTPATVRAATAAATSPNFGLAAKGLTLRTGTKGTGLTSLPTSFVPSELAGAAGPILLGA